jgi:hypothetical protein
VSRPSVTAPKYSSTDTRDNRTLGRSSSGIHTSSQSSKVGRAHDSVYSSYGNNSNRSSSKASTNSSSGLSSQLANSLQGFDLASLAALQAAATAQQQLLYGSQTTTAGSGSSRSSNSNNATSMSQLAAMSQAMMNPMMYPYQALAMAQLMGASQSTGSPGVAPPSSKTNGSSSQSAASQMIEIQRQAAEQLQRQYLLDMIPPGGLGNWGSATSKK